MSRILLAWELGGGAGHLAALRPVAEALLSRGHQVTLAARDIGGAGMIFGGLPMAVVQAPICPKTYSGLVDPPLNFAEILMRFGYLDVPMLKALLLGWRSLLELTGADRLVADHAPTALLAARGKAITCSTFGNPFSVPPPVSPMPGMRDWLEVPALRLQDSDARVVGAINAALGPGVPPLGSLHQLFEGAEHLFIGLPELDPYGVRPTARYLGLLHGHGGSAAACWPEGAGARLFAYLRTDYPHMELCLQSLAGSGANCLINLVGANAEIIARHQGPRLSFTTGYVDMFPVARQCDAAVCHSGLGTVNAMLRAGKPMLLLPAQLEQFLLARSVQKLGAGLAVHPEAAEPDIAGELRRVLTDGQFARNARAIAQSAAKVSVTQVIDRAVERIEAGPVKLKT